MPVKSATRRAARHWRPSNPMGGGQERILRGRIRSVQATKKITRAMELIAASRIVKAQQRVQAAVPYSEQITEVVKDLAAAGAGKGSPLLAGRDEVKTNCYVAIAADRGLCGGYNAGIQRATEGEIKADILAGRGYSLDSSRSQARQLLPLPWLQPPGQLWWFQRQPHLRARPGDRQAGRRAVPLWRGRSRRVGLHPFRLQRHPGSRPASLGAARRFHG